MSSPKGSTSPKPLPASPKPASPKAASPKAAPASPKGAAAASAAATASVPAPVSAPAPAPAPAPASPKSPKSPAAKRSASPSKSVEEKSPASKKAKTKATADPNKYHLNFNKAVDKEHESKSFNQIIKLPPSALQGLANRADPMFAHFNVKTIEDLASWKFYIIAKAISTLSNLETKDGRDEASVANINRALDKEYEKKSLRELAKAPVSALSGLADWADEVLKPLKIKTVADLGEFRFAKWAEALVTLAKFENADGSS